MKQTLLLVAVLLLLCVKIHAQHVTFMCGDNQVNLDSTVTLTCDFFTDSIVKIIIDKPYEGSRIQLGLFPESGQPAVMWLNVDEYTRSVTVKWRNFLKEGCAKGNWYIMYQKKEINIQNYIVKVEL